MDERPFRFYIPTPGPRWLFISLIVLSILTAVWLFREDFAGGAYIALGAALPLVPLALGVFRSYIEINPLSRSARFKPSWVARMLSIKESKSLDIPEGSELLLCVGYSYGLLDEYAIVVRPPPGDEQILWTGGVTSGFGYRKAGELAAALRRLGLPARLLRRELDEQGRRESEWFPPEPTPARLWVPLAIVAALPLAGVPIRFLTADRGYILSAGIALWFVALVLRTYSFRSAQGRMTVSAEYLVSLLTATVNFGVLYFLVVVMVSPVAERFGVTSH